MTTAQNLADIAADKLDRLATDIDEAASLDDFNAPIAAANAARTIADSRSEAAGALERFFVALPERSDHGYLVRLQAAILSASETLEPKKIRGWAKQWRAFADA